MSRSSTLDILMDKIGELQWELRTLRKLVVDTIGALEPGIRTAREKALYEFATTGDVKSQSQVDDGCKRGHAGSVA